MLWFHAFGKTHVILCSETLALFLVFCFHDSLVWFFFSYALHAVSPQMPEVFQKLYKN